MLRTYLSFVALLATVTVGGFSLLFGFAVVAVIVLPTSPILATLAFGALFVFGVPAVILTMGFVDDTVTDLLDRYL